MSRSASPVNAPQRPLFKPPIRPHIIDSIPNSAQLASIANAALQSVIVQDSPPPPIHSMTNNLPNSIPNSAVPPGYPLKYSSSSYARHNTVSSSPYTISSRGNTISTSPYTIPSSSNPYDHKPQSNTTKSGRSRKRGKRGGKKNKKRKSYVEYEDEKTHEQDVLDSSTEVDGVDAEEIEITKRNLINAIELERRNHELTKIRLVQLHKHYGDIVQNFKQENGDLKQRIAMYKNTPSSTDLEKILKQKQVMRKQYIYKKSMRLRDQEQIKQTTKENQKLMIIIHYLRQQLAGLEKQYDALCQETMDTKGANTKNSKGISEAERIMHSLDTLDIVAAESLVSASTESKLKMELEGTTHNFHPLAPPPDALIQENPWFHKVIEENKMLERHIRFMQHIIQRETARCNFREIITGKQILAKPSEEEKTKP